MTSRRWPVLSTVLIVLNVLGLVLLWNAEGAHRKEVDRAVSAVGSYWQEHPSLDAPAVLEERGFDELLRPRTPAPARPSFGGRAAAAPEEVAELDRLAHDLVECVDDAPARRWGFVPKEPHATGLFTSMFLHGGLLHLLGNMWFLWLCACNLEDRWGRPVFLIFYLASGVVAALVHLLVVPESTMPMIGASGAIAGAMGAFLVIFARTKIRFAYLFFFGFRFKAGTFAAPAWLMLPLWLLEQIFWLVVSPQTEGGVAYGAHVGGFVFGAAFAGVMLVSGLDRRLDNAVETKVSTLQDPRLAAASAQLDQGNVAGALAALERLLAADPSSIDAYLEHLRAAKLAGDTRREASSYGRLIDLYLRGGHLRTAADLHAEAESIGRSTAIALATRLRLGEALMAAGDGAYAIGIYASAIGNGIHDAVTARAAVTYAKLLFDTGRRDRARAVLDGAVASGMLVGEALSSAREMIDRDRPRALEL